MSTRAQPLSWRATALCALALWAGTLLLYFKTLGFDFINLETKPVLLEHPMLYNSASLLSSLRQILFEYFPREEPLIVRDISWAIEARVFGLRNAVGHHLGQIVLNATNSVLAFAFVLRSTREPRVAIASAALFAVLPVHVQAVCWDMGRKDLLVALFMLLGLYMQCISLEQAGTHRARRIDALIWVVGLCALLSKFSAIVYCLVLALHRVLQPYLDGSLPPDAPLDWRAARRRALPMLLPMLGISAVIYYWYNLNVTQFGVLVGRGPTTLTAEHLRTLAQLAPLSIALDVKLIFWPFDYSLYYLYPNANLPPSWLQLCAGYAACLVLLGATLIAARRRKDVLFFLLGFELMMLPYLNIQDIGIWIADRYVYSSALMLLAAAALWIERGARPSARTIAAVACALLVTAGAARTFVHEDRYHDDLTLWSYEVGRTQPAVLAWEALAREYVYRAKRAAPGRDREHWTNLANDTIRRGLAYYEGLHLRTSGSRQAERLNAATMLRLRGELLLLEPVHASAALETLRAAQLLAKTGATALLLAQATMLLANEEGPGRSEPWVRMSFAYFAQYVEFARADPEQRGAALDMLVVNYNRFAYLAREVRALEQSLR